jgi:hypothetical protein
MPNKPRSAIPQKGYLVTHARANEIEILEDNVLNEALLETPERTIVLSHTTAGILRNALLGSRSADARQRSSR